jgi:uncharacterized OB-fold protein
MTAACLVRAEISSKSNHREMSNCSPLPPSTTSPGASLPWGFDQRYLVIGIAEFENGVKAMGQIKADSADQLCIGMTLKASWEPVRVQFGEDVYGLKFEPV